MNLLLTKARLYWPLIKSLQTGLLLATGLAGYMSARCPITHWIALTNLAGSLFLAISGSTVLNMWHDREIDSRMKRTHNRPLASSKLSPQEVLWFGILLSMLGVSWAVVMKPLYGLVVFAGLFFDVIVYTMWLKRRTCWSIVWGGVSGGMPILAGRVLGTGGFDWIGMLLCLSVLFWIPTHIMTFSMKYHDDYQAAGIPTFPSTYGFGVTRSILAISNVIAAASLGAAAVGIGMTWGYMRLMILLAAGLLGLTVNSLVNPSERANFSLFKYASVYMLGSMLLVVFSSGG
jgi:protoheme IX farnesyltransferase